MKVKIGCDIVHIPRFKKILERTPEMRKKIFLPEEERGASVERLAGIFAAKEAAVKALGLPAGEWHEIEISHEADGKPVLAGKYKGELSIAHDGEYAIALVIFPPQ